MFIQSCLLLLLKIILSSKGAKQDLENLNYSITEIPEAHALAVTCTLLLITPLLFPMWLQAVRENSSMCFCILHRELHSLSQQMSHSSSPDFSVCSWDSTEKGPTKSSPFWLTCVHLLICVHFHLQANQKQRARDLCQRPLTGPCERHPSLHTCTE